MSAPNSAQVQSSSRPAVSLNRGRKKHRDRGKGQREAKAAAVQKQATGGHTESAFLPEDDTACWICAEPVKFYSVSECNHRTCHVCALRLRVLYKRMDCTFCKHPQNTLIFTRSSRDHFESYTSEAIPFKDNKLSIFFETQNMMEEALILLRYNCPEPSCDFRAHGWGDLKTHVGAEHRKAMCDMCIRHKKVFAHEHILYLPSQLPFHLPSIPHRPGQNSLEKLDGGVHPLCEFCHNCYFGDDELFAHMRERHEECFLCKREGIKDQHFKDYNNLERHFEIKHFLCKDPQCLSQKFVVFGAALDLQAHMLEQHGNDMTARVRKDTRRVGSIFRHEGVGGLVGRNRRQGGMDSREREPPEPDPVPMQTRRRPPGVGVTLAGELTRASGSSVTLQHSLDDVQNFTLTDVDPDEALREATFIASLKNIVSSSATAVPVIQAAIRSYRASESRPRDLVLTVFNATGRDLDRAAGLVSSLVELFDNVDKRHAFSAAWDEFELEQQSQFPDLNPGVVDAGVTGGRMTKYSSAVQSSSTQPSRQVLNRVAQVAASSASPLPSNAAVRLHDILYPTPSKSASVFRPQHTTAWSTAGASPSVLPSRASASSSGNRPLAALGSGASSVPRTTPSQISATLFPTLPSIGSKHKYSKLAGHGNQSLKHTVGEAPSSNPWSMKNGDRNNAVPTENDPSTQHDTGSSKGKKKGKGKQTLFTIGTFPT